ncbi:MAG: hypothetical protein Q9166_007509 [cf. Caloplaca sp. 2 TL-2023]
MAYYLMPSDATDPSIAPSLSRIKRGVGTTEASSIGTTTGSITNGTTEATNTTGMITTNGNTKLPYAAGTAATNGTTKAPYPYDTEAEPNNPTVIPQETLEKFHFTFLIRHPRSSIPSFYRCCVPPLDEVTGFYDFMPSEAGYYELRRLFDYLRSVGQVQAELPDQPSGGDAVIGCQRVELCVIDADDLLDNPAGMVEAFCKSTGIQYSPDMLDWTTEADQQQATEAFSKWNGWHDDALKSKDLKPRQHVSVFLCAWCNLPFPIILPSYDVFIDTDVYDGKKKKIKSVEDEDEEWVEKYGKEGAKVIRETVEANMKNYEYLKQFAFKV